MEETPFPTLQKGQVAVLCAERATGIILTEHFNRFIDESGEAIYSVFNSEDEAIIYVKEFINPQIEFVLYDHNRIAKLLDKI